MTKKKKGLFSSLKDKFSKKEDTNSYTQNDIEDEFELEDDEDFEDEHDEEVEHHFESVEDDIEDIQDDDDSIDSILADEIELSSTSEEEDEDSLPDTQSNLIDEELEFDAIEEEAYENIDETQENIEHSLTKESKASSFISSITSKFSKKNDTHDEQDFEVQNEIEQIDEDIELVSKQAHPLNIEQPLLNKVQNKKNDKIVAKLNNLKELSPEQFIPTLIGKVNQPFIHKSFVSLLFITCFYTVGKLTGLYFSQQSPDAKFNPQKVKTMAYNPRADINSIRSNNIFNVKETEDDTSRITKTKVPEIKICKISDQKTSLPIKLINTIVLQDSVKSVASVSERGKVNNYREGDKIGASAEIGKIDRLKMVFKNLKSGQCEFVENSDPAEKRNQPNKIKVASSSAGKKIMKDLNMKDIDVDGNKYNIKKDLRDKLLSNISEVITQARAIQIKNPDGTLSFKMTEIVPGSIFSSLNITDGDLITGVNGKKINNVNELMAMFGKLKENDTYELTVNRNGVETNLNYNFID